MSIVPHNVPVGNKLDEGSNERQHHGLYLPMECYRIVHCCSFTKCDKKKKKIIYNYIWTHILPSPTFKINRKSLKHVIFVVATQFQPGHNVISACTQGNHITKPILRAKRSIRASLLFMVYCIAFFPHICLKYDQSLICIYAHQDRFGTKCHLSLYISKWCQTCSYMFSNNIF